MTEHEHHLPGRPVRVAAANDYEIVVEGMARLLSRFPDRLTVCEKILVGEPVHVPVDLALYDTYGRVGVAEDALRTLLQTPGIAHVAVFSPASAPNCATLAAKPSNSGSTTGSGR